VQKSDETVFFGDYFEWQRSKARENVRKHKITFEEATEVFFFGKTQYYTDESHSFDERRFFAVGYTTKVNLLVVCYTERNRFHIISAWKANSSERRDYEEKRDEFKEYNF
jgi:uncharacterized DUF497 family protein